MRCEDLRIGQRVRVVEPFDGNPESVGHVGTVIYLKHNTYDCLVKFDNRFAGCHTGTVRDEIMDPDRKSYFGFAYELEPIRNDFPVEIKFTFDELMGGQL